MVRGLCCAHGTEILVTVAMRDPLAEEAGEVRVRKTG